MAARVFNFLAVGLLSATVLFWLPLYVSAASNYGDCAYGSLTYGGDCTPPDSAPTPAPASGGGGMIYGSGPLAPGWVNTNPQPGVVIATTTSASTTPAATTASTSPSVAALILTKNRQIWDRGADIRTLQKWLNAYGFPIASSGAGAPGHETSIFGNGTYRALVRFQKASGLPATGYLGPLTRASLAATSTRTVIVEPLESPVDSAGSATS